jgi:hypothetical protein
MDTMVNVGVVWQGVRGGNGVGRRVCLEMVGWHLHNMVRIGGRPSLSFKSDRLISYLNFRIYL